MFEYGTGCNVFTKVLKYRRKLCFIPSGNKCFGKVVENIYKMTSLENIVNLWNNQIDVKKIDFSWNTTVL